MSPVPQNPRVPAHFMAWLDALEHQTKATVSFHTTIERLQARSKFLSMRIGKAKLSITNIISSDDRTLKTLITRRANIDSKMSRLMEQMKQRIREAWQEFDEKWPGVEVKERIEVDGDELKFMCCGSTKINNAHHSCHKTLK